MKVRTLKQAQAEAVRLFGKNGGAGDRGAKHSGVWETSRGNKMHMHRYSVGAGFFGIAFEVKGEGDSWDEAFANAALHELRFKADIARDQGQRRSRDFVCQENEGRCRRKQLLDRAVEKAWEAQQKAEKRWGSGSNAEYKAYRAAQKAGEEAQVLRGALCPLHDGHDAFDAVLEPATKALWAALEELGWREYERREAQGVRS